MKIYKFKDLRKDEALPHLLQIVSENKIWCSSPGALNDPYEFRFKMEYGVTDETESLLEKLIDKIGTSQYTSTQVAAHAIRSGRLEEVVGPEIQNMIQACRESYGVSSFSMVGDGKELWKEYGGEGNGAVVEIEIPDNLLDKRYHIVDYVSERVFHVDLFLKSQVTGSYKFFKQLLCTKTRRWKDENEIRFLGKNQNVNITFENPVNSLTIGNKVSDEYADEIIRCCKNKGILCQFKD